MRLRRAPFNALAKVARTSRGRLPGFQAQEGLRLRLSFQVMCEDSDSSIVTGAGGCKGGTKRVDDFNTQVLPLHS